MPVSKEDLYLHLWHKTGLLTVKRYWHIVTKGGSFARAWEHTTTLDTQLFDDSVQEKLAAFRAEFSLPIEKQMLAEENIALVTYGSAAYPELLKHIYNPPVMLYVRGNTDLLQENGIAFVGTRKNFSYGAEVTAMLVKDLAPYFTIVSGLAYGIDTHAHQAALQYNGSTIAVLGGGIDSASIYPRENRDLALDIIRHRGLLVSEFPPRSEIAAFHFPLRNRIISGISKGTVVIEAPRKSGALITAELALQQGREVFAVPGSVLSRNSAGTNRLIQQYGAKLITGAADILEEFDGISPHPWYNGRENAQNNQESDAPQAATNLLAHYQPPTTDTPHDVYKTSKTNYHPFVFSAAAPDPAYQQVLDTISYEPIALDELVQRLNIPAATLSAALSFWELQGAIRDAGGKKYILS